LSYVLNTPEDQRAMLAAIGVSSIEELFDKIPPQLRLNGLLQVPAALSEIELTAELHRLAGRNRPAPSKSPVSAGSRKAPACRCASR